VAFVEVGDQLEMLRLPPEAPVSGNRTEITRLT